METKTMLTLKIDVDTDGVVVRYKDFVIAVEYEAGPLCEHYHVTIWQPIETEDETGEDFMNLRLKWIYSGAFPLSEVLTEGEAIKMAMEIIDNLGLIEEETE